jgi:hypothetical protein
MAVVGTTQGRAVHCCLKDLSLSGARMESGFLLEKECEIWLLFRVPASDAVEHVLAPAHVVRLDREVDEIISYGVHFDSVPERSLRVIDDYVAAASEAGYACSG